MRENGLWYVVGVFVGFGLYFLWLWWRWDRTGRTSSTWRCSCGQPNDSQLVHAEVRCITVEELSRIVRREE